MIFSRRGGQRRGRIARPQADVVHNVVITSGDPVVFEPGAQHQVTAAVFGYKGGIGDDPATDITSALTGKTLVWSVDLPSVATISGSGLLSAVSSGAVVVTVDCEGVKATKGYTVDHPQPTVGSILLTPLTGSIAEGGTLPVEARVFDGPSGTGNLLTEIGLVWSTSDAGVATVTADQGDPVHVTTVTGIAGAAAGTDVTITATAGGVTADCVVTVLGPASLIRSPSNIDQLEGSTAPTTWTVQDSQGRPISGRTVTVVSQNTNVVTAGSVSANGAVHSCTLSLVADGTTNVVGTVVGTSPAVTSTMPVVVQDSAPVPGTPTQLTVSPASVNQAQGTTATLVFTPRDNQGTAVPGQTVSVVSDTPSVATAGAVFVAGADHSSLASLVSTGSAVITGTVVGSSPLITRNVPITSNAQAAAWRTNTFGQYANLTALLADEQKTGNPNGWWSATSLPGLGGNQAAGEVSNTIRMSLETSGGPPSVGSSQFLRYTFPSDGPGVCGDYSISLNVKFGVNLTRVWFSAWVRFSANFTCLPAPTAVCAALVPPKTPPATGYKFLFGRVNGVGPRFESRILLEGAQRNGVYWPGNMTPSPGSQVRQLCNSIGDPTCLHYSRFTDGQWHRWRWYMDVARDGITGRPGLKQWFDNDLVYDNANDALNPYANQTTGATSIYGIGWGRNMNSVPPLGAVITVDTGRLDIFNADPGW